MRFLKGFITLVLILALGACSKSNSTGSSNSSSLSSSDKAGTGVLLYTGAGSSPTEIPAIESILNSLGLAYTTATETQINKMNASDYAAYKLILWAGGNSITMGDALTAQATAAVNSAVTNYGVSYLGICAGAFMGGTSTVYNVFNLDNGVVLDFYDESAEIIVPLSIQSLGTLQIVYWDGPQLFNFGQVIATYPNGESAIAEGNFGLGFVILSGVHPDAPQNWVSGMTASEHTADVSFAASLVSAAYSATPLPHF